MANPVRNGTKFFNLNHRGPAAQMQQKRERAVCACLCMQLILTLRDLGDEAQADHWLEVYDGLMEGL